ncbi:MAG TPA: hypothetical protein DET40_00265 [Lentisphaeria bacterium]|nr:MAG: hypothetical protein A2X45_10820 [Lentisphaerae bacterium GWF2_50_93]HCE41966.1 hypothetical protein [Lentisphaeria bacterium]
MIKFGFAKTDITPRVGVELSGFGAYLHRQSIAVRDRLSARAMAVADGKKTVVLLSLDLLLISREVTDKTRKLVAYKYSKPCDVIVHCTHTHSGPAVFGIEGWGEVDVPYCELLPNRLAEVALEAIVNMKEATVSHAEVPCVGIGLNREYDKDAPPIEDVMRDDWRPAKPELTDTTCHVLKIESGGKLVGFVSHFGCHPVVCCQKSRYIHGDYCGVATNILEAENPGAIGLFLQGALGDVNSCCVHKPEKESLEALDVIAARYVKAVSEGLKQAKPVAIDGISSVSSRVKFARKKLDLEALKKLLAEKENIFAQKGASDEDGNVRMAGVYVTNLRKLIARIEADGFKDDAAELNAIRMGPIAILTTPFEVFQAIKNDVKKQSRFKNTWVLSVTDEYKSYAPDGTTAKRGGYAADQVPMMIGEPPYADIHGELVKALIELEKKL